MKIYIHKNGQQLGPYTPEELKVIIASHTVALTDLAWWEGQATWTPLGQTPYAPLPSPAGAPATSPLFPSAAPITMAPATGLPGTAPVASKFAIASLVCGVLVLLCGVFTAIPAVILGHISLAEIKKNPGMQGRGQAIGGLVLGYAVIAIFVVALFAIIVLQGLGTKVKSTFDQIQKEQQTSQTNNAPAGQ